MKIRSSKPRGQRIFKCRKLNHQSCGEYVRTTRPFWIEPIERYWRFDLIAGEWTQEQILNSTTSYYAMTRNGFNNAYSLKAVKRLIKKWSVPKGTTFRASLPYVGYDFFIKKS